MKGEILEWPLIICATIGLIALFGNDLHDSITLLLSFWSEL